MYFSESGKHIFLVLTLARRRPSLLISGFLKTIFFLVYILLPAPIGRKPAGFISAGHIGSSEYTFLYKRTIFGLENCFELLYKVLYYGT